MSRRRRNIVVAAAAAVLVLAGRRRIAIAAAVVAAAVLVVVGLGMRGDLGSSDGEPCGRVSDYCARSPFACGEIPEEYADACEAECVAYICPRQVTQPEADPGWELPCTDMHGPRFWRTLRESQNRCEKQLEVRAVRVERATLLECWKMELERQCVGLAGTEWRADFDAMMND